MRKIIGLVLLASMMVCGAAYADGKTVTQDRDLITKSDIYADTVSAVTIERATAQQAVGKEVIDLRNDIEKSGSTIRPGADAVQNAEVSVTGSTAVKNLSDLITLITIEDDGAIKIDKDVILTPDQTLIIDNGSVTLISGNDYQTLVYGSNTTDVYISTQTSSPILNNNTSYVDAGSAVSLYQNTGGALTVNASGFIQLPGYENGVVGFVSGSIILPQESSGVGASMTVTSEVVKEKPDEGKAKQARKRVEKQRESLKKLVQGKSIMDKE